MTFRRGSCMLRAGIGCDQDKKCMGAEDGTDIDR